VTFSTAANYPDIRILEYSGVDTNNPIDVVSASTGNSATSSTTATTTTPTDLIFAANIVGTYTSGPGSGYTQRVLTNDGNIAEDQMVTTAGNYTATAPLTSACPWIMQMVAFRSGPNFTISASPSSLTVAQGGQGTSTITTTISGGFNHAISLSASGVPSGTTVNFSPNPIAAPGAGTSTMTISVGSSTAPGNYTITVTGDGGLMQHSTQVSLTVTTQQQPDFTIVASPSSLSVPQGNQGTSTITTTISGGFNNSISLSASGVPSGTTVNFSPNPIAAPGAGTSTMTITVGTSTPTGTYTITVTGSGGGIQHTTTVNLTVTTAGSPQVDLSWTASTSQVAGYNAYRSSTSGGPYTKLNSGLISGTSYTDFAVQHGYTYYYVTTSVDSQGMESSYSNEATATVP